MPQDPDTFLAELGLQRADHSVHELGDDPGSKIRRAGLTHPVLQRMLEEAESLAPLWKVGREVAFSLLRDLVIEQAERSPFGLVAREPESNPGNPGSMSLNELLTEAAKLTDARHGPLRASEWAVALDAEDQERFADCGGAPDNGPKMRPILIGCSRRLLGRCAGVSGVR